jgi:hypothetical protein
MDLTAKSIDFDKVGRALLLCFCALIIFSYFLAFFCCPLPFVERRIAEADHDTEANRERAPLLANET